MNRSKTYTLQEAQTILERYCSYQERTHKEVISRLIKMGMISEAIDLITISLLQNDFLNEERFAKSFARGKFRINKWGKIKITQHLVFKGISKANITIGLLEIDDEEYKKTILSLADKKRLLIKEENKFKKNQKLIQYLQQKGFETSIIYECIIN